MHSFTHSQADLQYSTEKHNCYTKQEKQSKTGSNQKKNNSFLRPEKWREM